MPVGFLPRLARFARDQRGGLAVILSVAMLPLTVAAGAAVDVTRMSLARSHLQDALDAATLAAARAKDDGAQNADIQAEGERFFAANCHLEELCSQVSDVSFQIEPDGVSGNVSADLPMHFMQVVGINARSIAAGNAAVIPDYRYETFYFAIDMSGSMGIAADQANRLALESLTQPYMIDGNAAAVPEGCTFACHTAHNWDTLHPYANSYDLARAYGISLREDVLLEDVEIAANALLGTAPPHKSDSVQVAAYGFSNSLASLVGPTSSGNDFHDGIASGMAPVYTTTITSGGGGDDDDDDDEDEGGGGGTATSSISASGLNQYGTDYGVALPELADLVGSAGTGGSPHDRLKSIILLTDGFYHTRGSSGPLVQGPIDLALCDQIKSRGIRLIVVDINYVDLTGNTYFDSHVLPHYDELSPALRDCASTGFYYSAENPADIEAALAQMVNDIVSGHIRLAR